MTNIKNKTVQDSQEFIRIQDLFHLCMGKWYWFVISLTICLGTAFGYLLTTQPVYTRSASILIKDDSKGNSSSVDMSSFSDLGLLTSNSNLNNEMGILGSPDIMREVVSRLNLNTDYHVDATFHKKTVYGNELPLNVEICGLSDEESAVFTLTLAKGGEVSLSSFKRNGEEVDSDNSMKVVFNDTIVSSIGKIVVLPTSTFTEESEAVIHVSHLPLSSITDDYASRLNITQSDEKSNIINLSLQDVSTQRAEDVLNMLIAVYNETWVKDKNQVTVNTSMFINERLSMIESELGNVDNDISSYKSKFLLPDVKAAASMYMVQANQANVSAKELSNQVTMANYIKKYLTNEANRFKLLPANSGIENITAQIGEYNNKLLERNSLAAHSSSKNPLVIEMDASLALMRSALITSIDNQIVALNTQIKSMNSIGGEATSQIASNPKQTKYLLSVERQQKVKESLYLYLLQKREENELSQAFTAYNTRIISKPGGSMIPTAPVKKNIVLVAFALGLMIPVVVIFIGENMNTKLRGRNDLKELSVPFIGEIPMFKPVKKGLIKVKEKDAIDLVVKEGNRDIVNESFRVLRTNLEFMVGEDKTSNVIMMTSFNPGSGKSSLTLNIATSLAIKGKKVLIIDGDMRHASISSHIDSPKSGMSNYLSGRVDNLSEVTVNASWSKSLFILPVGTIPPNPTELLFDKRMKQIIDKVREEFDYVFIDAPPVELMADAQILEKLADRTIFVLRAGVLEKGLLTELERNYNEKKFKNISMILNGTELNGSRYGSKYGYHYGYGSGYYYGGGK